MAKESKMVAKEHPDVGLTRSGWVEYDNGVRFFVLSQADFEALKPTEETQASVAIKMRKNDLFYEPTQEEIAEQVADTRERVDCMHAVAERRGGVPLWKVTEDEIAAERAARHAPEQAVVDFDANRNTVAPKKPENAFTRFINKLIS